MIGIAGGGQVLNTRPLGTRTRASALGSYKLAHFPRELHSLTGYHPRCRLSDNDRRCSMARAAGDGWRGMCEAVEDDVPRALLCTAELLFWVCGGLC